MATTTISISSFFFYVSLFLLSLLSPALSILCRPEEKQVLIQFKKEIASYNNLTNPLPSWDPDTDCCYWYGIECHVKTHHVISLTILSNIPDPEFATQIPPSIGDLSYLQTIRFHKLSNLTGPIQPTLANLSDLRFLTVSWTNVSGPVPDFLAQLKNLVQLDLSYNNLSGYLPPSLSHLPNLTAIDFRANKLTGQIPESYGHFPSSQNFYLILSHNRLSGTIPESLGNMNFSRIDLSRNMLEDDASMLFGSSKTLQMLDLSRNLFEFNLSNVEFPKSLIAVDVNHNKIYGGINVGLTSVDYLQFLNLSYNRLCGEIPQGGSLQKFDVTSYFHNKCLCGSPLPSCKP